MSICLVTGAAGFIGSHLAETLLAQGHRVVGLDCFTDYYPRPLKERNLSGLRQMPDFTFVEADLRTADLAPLMDGVETVFHQAAMAGLLKSWTSFDQYMTCNILGTQRLLEASRQVGVRHFIHASTSSVYGREATGDETRPLQPASPYGLTKLAAEHLVWNYRDTFGVPVTVLRYFSVYGPRQRPDMAFHRFCKALLRGEEILVYGDGKQSRDFTFIDDAIEANVRAWQRSAPQGVYNVGGGSQVEVLEAIALLEGALGVKANLRFEERPPGDPLRTRADAARLQADLGYVTRVGIADGLAAEAAWARGLYGASA